MLVLALAGCGATGPQSVEPEAPRVFPPPPAAPAYLFERSVYEADDLTNASSSNGFLEMLVGTRRGGGQGLSRPLALAVHLGRVAVINALDPSLSVFDFAQHRFSKIDLSALGGQRSPVGISVDRSGNWYVADGLSGYVLVLDAQGRELRKIGGPRWLRRLVNVAVDSDRQRVYAIDQSERQHQVRVFNAVTGSHLMDLGGSGEGPGEFNLPLDAAVGPGGRLYVVDSGNYRVQIFDAQGQYLKSFGSAGKRPGQFSRPKEIAVDGQGLVYVADATFGNIQVFGPDGDYRYVIGSRGDQGAAATYMLPSGLGVDTDSRLYVLDQWYVRLDVYRSVRHRVGVATPPLQ
ncbi:MAG: 6-bladed beta-propeller [Rhodoferax sp.]|nr:6-bladed beta-propeller [Rhodoferax sp.]